MENIKAKIQGILMNCSQKSVIGWAVEESDFEHVAEEIVKNLDLCAVGNSYGVNENDINDYGEYMFTDVGLGNFPEIDFKEWLKSDELQKRRKNYH